MKITELQPALVWQAFDEITKVPRPTHHLDKMKAFLLDWAKRHGIEAEADEVGNVVMRVPATPGHENAPTVVLQGHQDMVAEKLPEVKHDFLEDPITTVVDGDWVRAEGTTLGADNGLGCASAMACLTDPDLVHGPLEALFTVDEEQGLIGANGLQAGFITGDILLNLDSETEGELYVGCAGGMDANMTFDYAAAAVPAGDYKAVRLTVKGLKGGHSGIQIVAQRANANKLLFRLLNAEAAKRGLLLASVDGGGLRNAIPREAEAVVLVPAAEYAAFAEAVKSYEKTVVAEFAGIEDSVSVRAELCDAPAAIIPADVASKLIRAVAGCPDGVVRMSAAMPGLVQTSSNLARVVSDGTTVRLQALLRSSVRSEKEALGEAIAAVFALAGARTELTGSYDGWNPDMSSPILKAMTASYEQLYGRKPAVTAIHAGLECGIIGSNYPGLDMISFGPTICYPHSPDEKVEIASVAKFYDFLVRTLANIPQK